MKDKNSILPFFWDDERSLSSHFYDHHDIALSEDKGHVYVEAAVPGIPPEEIEINYDQGILCIKADAKEEAQDKDRKFYRKTSKHFFYQIPVPGQINENQMPEAVCKDGVLKVCFSKRAEGSRKKIEVKKG